MSERREAEIRLDNECGVIINFSNEPAADVDTCTEAKVTVYKNKDGKTIALDIECDEDE